MPGQAIMTDGRRAPDAAGRGLSSIWRVLLVWIVTAGTLLFVAWALPGFDINGFGSALAAAAVLGLLNALVWPVLVRLLLPLTVLTLGLAPLVLNGLVVSAVAWALPGVTLDGVWWGLA